MGPVGRSSKNRNFVTKNSTKILKIERGVLKIETPIFERIGPPQAQLAAPIASGTLNLKTFFQEGLPVAAGANVMQMDPTVASACTKMVEDPSRTSPGATSSEI